MRASVFCAVIVLAIACAGISYAQPRGNLAVPSLDKLDSSTIKIPEGLEPLRLPTSRDTIYVATRDVAPGVVFAISGGAESPVYTRTGSGKLTSFDFGTWIRDPRIRRTMLYFCNGISDKKIFFAAAPGHEAVLGTHSTWVREVDFGPRDSLYFSESSGSAGDGKIFRIAPGGSRSLYYVVKLARVGGFWAGNFAFDPKGRLYISNGNIAGAQIWACPLGAAPKPVYKEQGNILGFHFTDERTFLYTDGSPRLKKAQIGGGPSVVFTSPRNHQYCDVVVR